MVLTFFLPLALWCSLSHRWRSYDVDVLTGAGLPTICLYQARDTHPFLSSIGSLYKVAASTTCIHHRIVLILPGSLQAAQILYPPQPLTFLSFAANFSYSCSQNLLTMPNLNSLCGICRIMAWCLKHNQQRTKRSFGPFGTTLHSVIKSSCLRQAFSFLSFVF